MIDSRTHWETPIPFRSTSCDVPFPLDALAAPFADMAQEVSKFVQMPQDLATATLWALPGACIGNRAVIEVSGSHTETPALWTCGIAGTGDRKSSMLSILTEPLHQWEAFEAERLGPAINEIRAMREIAEEELKSLRQKSKNAKTPEAKQALAKEMAEVIQRTKASFPSSRLLIQDVTPEAMVGFLARHGGNAFLCSDEGAVFFETCRGRYSKDGNANLDSFLNAFSGSPIRIDRTTREGESVNSPCLAMVLLIQPTVLDSIDDSGRFRGRGLLARFNYAFPASQVGRRTYQTQPISASVRDRYAEAVHSLLIAARESNADTPHRSVFTSSAVTLFGELHDAFEKRIGPGGDLEHIEDWVSRHPGQLARIAFGLAAVEAAINKGQLPEEVTDEHLTRAASLSPALIEHAQAVICRTGVNQKEKMAKRLLGWVEKRRVTSFKIHEVCSCWRQEPKESIEAAAANLCDRHYLAKTTSPSQGRGRPSDPLFHVHPSLHSQDGSDNSENSINPSIEARESGART